MLTPEIVVHCLWLEHCTRVPRQSRPGADLSFLCSACMGKPTQGANTEKIQELHGGVTFGGGTHNINILISKRAVL